MNINDCEYLPFTCIKSSIESIEKQLRIEEKEGKYRLLKGNYSCLDVLDISDMEHIKPYYRTDSYKAVLFRCVSNKDYTVLVSNLRDGWFTICNYLCSKMNVDYYQFSISNIFETDPMNRFIYFSGGDEERVVYSMKENKWVFCEIGNVLPFEDAENYKTRRIKDRLNKEILMKYCKRLGFNIEDESFWKGGENSLLFEHTW